MTLDVKRLSEGQVHGLLLALRIVLLPFRVHRAKEYHYMLRLMGLDKKLAWTRFFARLVPSIAFIAFMVWAWFMLGTVLMLVAWFLVNEVAGRGYKVAVKPRTTTRRGLQKFMVEEALVKVKEDEKPPKLIILSQTEDENGKTLRVRAPASSTVDVWAKKSDLIANRAGVPSMLCEVTDDPDTPPNVFDIWIGNRGGRKTRSAFVPETCDFHEPFRIGVLVSGAPVLANTFEHNTLVGGIPGMGKTSVVRQFMVRCLKDPAGQVYLVDGKGSKKDYKGAIHAYSGYVDGNDDDALEQVEALLTHIHAEVNRLNAENRLCKILLVLDEWQDIRAGGDKDTIARIDALLNRIHKKGRATGLHIILATQRASAFSIPTEVRALFRQALGFRQRNTTDYVMVLGTKIEDGLSAPRNPGEAIVLNDAGQRFVLIDYLSDEQWIALIPSLAERESLTLSVQVSDPLLTAIKEIAHRLTDERVSPSDLLAMIPEDIRPERVEWLGRFLAAQGVTPRNSGGRYYLVDDLRRVA